MHMTFEAVIEPDGRIRILENIQLAKPVRALITILETEEARPRQQSSDFSGLLTALSEFPDDFMSTGREQPVLQEREVIF